LDQDLIKQKCQVLPFILTSYLKKKLSIRDLYRETMGYRISGIVAEKLWG